MQSYIAILFYFKFSGDQVVLVRKESLRYLKDQYKSQFESTKDMTGIIKSCWDEKSFSKILKAGDFKKCSFEELKELQFATINCVDDTLWTTLVEFIFGINGVQSEFIFLDAFCIDHSVKSVDQREIMKQRSKIFEHSKEHHIIEPTCMLHSENWYDLSFIDRRQRPTVHISAGDPVADQKLLKLIKSRGFECIDVYEPWEADVKEFVKQSIVSSWGTMDDFNARVQETVVNAMELSQVKRCVIHTLSLS